MIIGGTFDKNGGKPSAIVKMLAKCLNLPSINGGSIKRLKESTYLSGTLNIWMPNVSNEEVKVYPHKKQGSIVICSKILRPGKTLKDAVSAICIMQANAVIVVDSGTDFFKFTLIDTLGNVWVNTSKIIDLAKAIKKFQRSLNE